MWNLSLEDVQRAKEELKGRRAAVQARYEDDVKSIDGDLANIDALQRAADLFVAKHKAELPPGEAVADLVPASDSPWTAGEEPAEAAAAANWRSHLDKSAEAEPAVEPESAAAGPGGKGASRWRMHIGNRSDAEPA